ncbi:MAG TPA: hypothetical protein VMV03_14130 [Spirochaetia bacterium]|nr:hypothetical protein [Spirochaetia bacterium]
MIPGTFAALLLLAGPMTARADELAAWYGSDTRSAAYSSIRDELQEVFSQARKAQVPLWVLGEKLREGACKKVSADTLLRCVRGEEARLERAQSILARAQVAGARPGTRAALTGTGERSLKAVGIYLRAGLPDPLVGDLLAAGAATPGGEDVALSACETIVTLRSLARVADTDSLAIGKLLIAKSSEPLGYASLGPVFARARARGLSNDRIVKDVVIASLSSGGGAASMNELIEKFPQPAPRVVRAPAPKKMEAPPAAAMSPGPPAAEPSTTTVTLPPLRVTIPPGSSTGRTPGGPSAGGMPGFAAPASQGPAPASMGPSSGGKSGN